MMENIMVAAIVFLAFVWIVRRFRAGLSDNGPGCGSCSSCGCGSCPAKQAETGREGLPLEDRRA